MPKIESDDISNKGNKIFVTLIGNLIKQIQYKNDEGDISKKEKTINSFRLKHFKNALRIIKSYPDKIKSTDDIKDIKGIGKGVLSRIEEILKTKKLSELEKGPNIKKINKEINVIDQLTEVINIGRKKAKELVKEYNIKSVSDLKKRNKSGEIELNSKILLGLKYYNKVKLNIPRNESDKYYKLFKEVGLELDKDLIITICGSYRREKKTSNDIDVLITHKKIITDNDKKKNINYLVKFIEILKKLKVLKDDMTDGKIITKYMGFCRLKNKPIRRIDIRYVPYRSYYPALLYFTGSYKLNQDMRQFAKSLGYKLNEYGLYKITIKDDKEKFRFIKVKSEKDIFDKLGLDYLEPKER